MLTLTFRTVLYFSLNVSIIYYTKFYYKKNWE